LNLNAQNNKSYLEMRDDRTSKASESNWEIGWEKYVADNH